jgi:hypothetical protein
MIWNYSPAQKNLSQKRKGKILLINDYLIDYSTARYQAGPQQFITKFSASGFVCPRCGKPTRGKFLLTQLSMTDFLPSVICDECQTIFFAESGDHINKL